jgi:hypothetical protein
MTELAREIVRLSSMSHGYELATRCSLTLALIYADSGVAPRRVELCLCRRRAAAGGGAGEPAGRQLAAADASFRLVTRLPTDKDAALRSLPLAQFLAEVEFVLLKEQAAQSPLAIPAPVLELRSVLDAAGPPLLRKRVFGCDEFRGRLRDAAWDMVEHLRTQVEPGPGPVP